ncbi:PREDICTED: putative F-box protein At3g52320 [Ipomoea nil]|uniref:putative F-box protein At3g52320 n=1 Tax=Ipomoea nil TaxID=35883 RepID=UPI0009009A89|nr:PREDICTED: putative F-box protein At3g52320 [Ipomoea nil]
MSSSKKASASAIAFLPQGALPILPEEIIVLILSKLPAKSLVRFKCVSKFVCSLIVDHSFADLHRNWSLTLPSRIRILISLPTAMGHPCGGYHLYFTINYSEENQGMFYPNRLRYMNEDPKLYKKFYISSSVNGLICFCPYSLLKDSIVIHNLSTRQYISLPRSCRRVSRSESIRMQAFGLLGFDSISKRYKVLKSVLYYTKRPSRLRRWVKHYVFTLGVDESWRSWREIHSSSTYYPYTFYNNHFYSHTNVHIDGVIYFLNSYNKGEIVAFDVRSENFQAIPPPPPSTIPGLVGEGEQGHSGRSGLVEVDGRLAIVDLLNDHDHPGCYGIAIWILEESMVWKNQYLIITPIPLEKFDESSKRVLCVATNHVGEITLLVKHLVRQRSTISILFYNFRKKNWRKFDIRLPWYFQYAAMYFVLDNVF